MEDSERTPQEPDVVRADPALEQYFLVAPGKLGQLVEAAAVRPSDHVVEIGAGIGTVARALPDCSSLTLVELDPRLIPQLRRNVPHARILQGDALTALPQLQVDVLVSNLPGSVTDELLDLLVSLSFRTAVLAVGNTTDVRARLPGFTTTEITTISGRDFHPPQPGTSRLVKVTPVTG